MLKSYSFFNSMPSILYSTICYIKNDLYRLRIYVDDENIDTPSQVSNDSLEFTPIDIPIDHIKPSLTRLTFELLDDKKINQNIPRTIPLNHLLNVKQTIFVPKKYKNLSNNVQTPWLNTPSGNTPIIGISQETSQTTLTSESLKRRQFSFRRFFSSSSSQDSEIITLYRTLIKISYVDVSNSIRWNIKSLELELDTEDIANELNVNLNLCLSTLRQRPRSLLAFVNPLSGKGRKKKKHKLFKVNGFSIDRRVNIYHPPTLSSPIHQKSGEKKTMHFSLVMMTKLLVRN